MSYYGTITSRRVYATKIFKACWDVKKQNGRFLQLIFCGKLLYHIRHTRHIHIRGVTQQQSNKPRRYKKKTF